MASSDSDQVNTELTSNSSQCSNPQPIQLAPEQLNQLISALQQQTFTTPHSIGQIRTNTPRESSTNQQPYPSNHSFRSSDWILDSGATDHVTHDFNLFMTFHFIKHVSVHLPNGLSVSARYCGCIKISKDLWLYNVLYIPEFTFNIISIPKLISAMNCKLTFCDIHCYIQDMPSLKMIRHAELHQGLYHLKGPIFRNNFICITVNPYFISVHAVKTYPNVWYLRLGHPSDRILEQLYTTFPYVTMNKTSVCDACHFAKQNKLPYSASQTVTDQPFQLLHMDIWGPLSVPSSHGHKYFLTVVDDYTRHTWIFLMKLKSETRALVENFILFVKNQFNSSFKTIRSDNDAKFINPALYNKFGILHHTSCVATP